MWVSWCRPLSSSSFVRTISPQLSTAVKDVTAQRVANGQARMVEVVGGIVREADLLHDAAGAEVRSVVNETIGPDAIARTARAPSVARPRPQCSAASRQPISTHGVKCASKIGTERPMKPMNSPL